jgi:formylmethanofuran dehydrogenase subunit A
MIELTCARIVDPLHPDNGRLTSLYIQGDHFVHPSGLPPSQQIDLRGCFVLAGGIDLHTHIGGGKVNLARLLMASSIPQQERTVWPTIETGRKYACMGYTCCFEPAMLLSSARHTHLELADTPVLDCGAYVVVGNEEWLLKMLGRPHLDQAMIDSWVAWAMQASGAVAVKAVNPGGISAFKFNQRRLDLDTPHVKYGVTPRQVIQALAAAADRLGLAHPLHLHASNLGMPGNVHSTIASLKAAEGHRVHLTHAQFNCYSDMGPHGMGSGAEQLARYINQHPEVTLDVGQVMFGQTVTISADIAAQSRILRHAHPKLGWLLDQECQAGCGVVPIKYSDKQYLHSLQWSIGLELLLLVKNPWQIFLTTDHPNGAPFTCYPHLIRLLMDRSFRQSMLETVHPQVAASSILRELDRQYCLDEVATITRAAPAKILGLEGLGSLQVGCQASLAAYEPADDWQKTFQQAKHVFKSGVPIVCEGRFLDRAVPRKRWIAQPQYDPHRLSAWRDLIQQSLHLPMESLAIGQQEHSLLGMEQLGYSRCKS